jgi:hypothetical protein
MSRLRRADICIKSTNGHQNRPIVNKENDPPDMYMSLGHNDYTVVAPGILFLRWINELTDIKMCELGYNNPTDSYRLKTVCRQRGGLFD